MTTRVVRSSGLGLIVGAVAVVAVLCVASSALASSCTVTGTFMFTTTDGAGRLVLSADGRAAMVLSVHHPCIDVCGTLLSGTYETRVFGDDGLCDFALDFRPQPGEIGGRTITMSGVVAFKGLVLMFQRSSEPGLGAGLAIRTDMLTGQ